MVFSPVAEKIDMFRRLNTIHERDK